MHHGEPLDKTVDLDYENGHKCDYSEHEICGFQHEGPAFDGCFQHKNGTFWVVRNYFDTFAQVNFCPFCGAEAPVKYKPKLRDVN